MMINIVTTTTAIITTLAAIGALIFTIKDTIKYKKEQQEKTRRWSNQDKTLLAQQFLTSNSSEEAGQMFVDLVECGFFGSLKTVNHGERVNDARKVDDFRKSMNSEIAISLREVAIPYE